MMSPVERDFARRLHAAAIAKGKAEAALERLPADLPKAFRVRALCEVAQAGLNWLRVYFEIVEHFKAERAQGIEAATAAETVKLGSVHESPVGEADAPERYSEHSIHSSSGRG